MKLLILMLVIGMIAFVPNISNVSFGAVTGSTNYCNQFPTYPECTGWRVEPITDNFWFCAYVNLPTVCGNPPDPKKEIVSRTGDYCCGILGSHVPKNVSFENSNFVDTSDKGKSLDEHSTRELLIWTQMDHYFLGDTVNVYGKFNFNDPILKNHNQFVDVILNDRKVILDLPVHPNGWFAGYFTLSNPYLFHTGNNLLSVTYFHNPTLENPDKFTQASYKFTTGDVRAEPFFIQDDDSSVGKISYKVSTESGESVNMDLAVVRLVMPDGVVLPLPNVSSVDDITDYLDDPLVSGTYEVVITKGNHSASQIFEYVE